MHPGLRASLVTAISLATAGTALAQVPPPAGAPEEPSPEEGEAEKKQPGRGDFDFGAQARFPNGPDQMGEFGQFNWVAADVKGRYFVFDGVTINGNFPLAVIKPDELAGGLV